MTALGLVLGAVLVADAQVQLPTTLPANTVVGRLGITPGAAQAIPFAQLAAQIGLPAIATSNVLGYFGGGTGAPVASPVPSCANDGAHALANPASGGLACATIPSSSPGSLVPQGRLTLTASTPVITTDVVGATTIYYAPLTGPYVPIYNGTNVQNYAFTTSASDTAGMSIVLGSNWAAATNYDFFVGLNSSTPTLCSGPAWTGSTARGTGAATTELVVYNGLETNANAMTCRYANTSTINCGVNQCTYLGTCRTNANAGQIDIKFGSLGANGGIAVLGCWNAYNRVNVAGSISDSTDTWTYGVSTVWRAANGSATMRVNAVRGLAIDSFEATYYAEGLAGAATHAVAGVGLDSTTAFCGHTGDTVSATAVQIIAHCAAIPGIGLHFLSAIEFNNTATASTWVGDSGTAFIQTGLDYSTTW